MALAALQAAPRGHVGTHPPLDTPLEHKDLAKAVTTFCATLLAGGDVSPSTPTAVDQATALMVSAASRPDLAEQADSILRALRPGVEAPFGSVQHMDSLPSPPGAPEPLEPASRAKRRRVEGAGAS